MDPAIRIRALSADEIPAAAPALAEVLADCVDGGASVSFMADVPLRRLEAFWREVGESARLDRRAVLAAERDGAIVGVVQVIPVGIDNQPHRAEIAKMLVHRRARRLGVGAALMAAAEDAARAMGRTLLTLDTVTDGDGERLYRRMGWTFAGTIPGYALFPDGRPASTSYFYKQIAP
jgi:GNAT superfamily N-acetyltransferase